MLKPYERHKLQVDSLLHNIRNMHFEYVYEVFKKVLTQSQTDILYTPSNTPRVIDTSKNILIISIKSQNILMIDTLFNSRVHICSKEHMCTLTYQSLTGIVNILTIPNSYIVEIPISISSDMILFLIQRQLPNTMQTNFEEPTVRQQIICW